MKKATILIGVMMFVMACRVGTVDPPASSSSAKTLSPANIVSSAQGANAASQILQTRELTTTSTQLFKNIGDLSLSVMTPALLNQNTDIVCSDGGTFKYSGSYSTTTGSYNLSFTFNGCRDKGNQYVGSTTVSGTTSNFTVVLGGSSTFNIFNFNTAYTVLLAYLKANLSFTMVGSGTSTDAAYAINTSGTVTSFDYFLLNTFTMTFSGFKSSYTLATSGTTSDQTITVATDGQFNESWGGTYNINIRATDFTVSRTRYFNAPSGTYYAESSSLSGTVLYTVRPTTFGFSGLFNVTTQTPVRTVYSPRQTTQGTLNINGSATVQYNVGGDATVSVAGDTPLSYPNEYVLMKTSDFAAMEQDKPPLITPPVPGVTSTVTGSTMGVTLTWTGPPPVYSSTSDMDLHMKYYDTTAPTGSTAEAWHVDWHQGVSCTNPPGLVFGKAGFDLNADGVCDVGLDFDDVDGYGPEHITALKMLPGYYVISVDSYSLNGDASASLYLSVNVGDNIFGAYLGTMPVADGESTMTAAWLRVADVRVNTNGTVDVLSPDPTLTPWH